MKKNNLILFCLMLIMATGAISCLKKIDIFQSNNISITLTNVGSNYVTSDVTVNPKDLIAFSYAVASAKDMKYVSIQKNGVEIVKDTLTNSNKNSFNTLKSFVADSATGVYTYRILVKDAAGIYMGDKTVAVTVNPDFNFYSVRTLFVPDSSAKTNRCFFSTSTGNTYSYSNGAANAGSIDFGYFYDTTTALLPKHTIFSLEANTFSPYDLTTWTKNATIFKKITTPTFVNLNSKGILRATGIANLATGATNKITSNGIAAGNLTGVVLIFKTAAGKYGAMNIVYTNQNAATKDTYLTVDVKIEK